MPNTDNQYQQCFVAYLDILGFTHKVINSQDSSDKIKILLDSLRICGAFPSGGKKTTEDSGTQRTIDIRSRFFSDTIVFILKENESDIAQLFFMIRYLQDRLWEQEVCLRGAITRGKMYWPGEADNITLGPGIIEAYHLESNIAIYPRIILSNDLYDYISNHVTKADPFGGGLRGQKPDAVLKDYIKRDADGVYFLNLLHPEILRAQDEKLIRNNNKFTIMWYFDSESNHGNILAKLDEIIAGNINPNEQKICQKYNWLKSYRESILTQ